MKNSRVYKIEYPELTIYLFEKDCQIIINITQKLAKSFDHNNLLNKWGFPIKKQKFAPFILAVILKITKVDDFQYSVSQ